MMRIKINLTKVKVDLKLITNSKIYQAKHNICELNAGFVQDQSSIALEYLMTQYISLFR